MGQRSFVYTGWPGAGGFRFSGGDSRATCARLLQAIRNRLRWRAAYVLYQSRTERGGGQSSGPEFLSTSGRTENQGGATQLRVTAQPQGNATPYWRLSIRP